MARTPLLERQGSIRTLGALLVAIMLFFLWLTFAFFNRQFVDFEPITVRTSKAGVNLPQNADVKLRGVIVGEVRSIEPDGDGITMNLAMKPELLGDVPRGVTAQIVPKTLFGEKFVSLIPPENLTGESLQAGDVIDRAVVPIEVEDLLNDLQPLLTAVDPANLSYTLTALADALEGRGTELGETLVTANSYIKKVNPEVPQLVEDVKKLGEVSDAYADAMPDLGRTLRNLTVTGDTVVAKRAQLAAFFDESTALSNTLTSFTQANGDNIIKATSDYRPVLDVFADAAPTYPCVLGSIRELIPRLDSAFRDSQLHINARIIKSPTPYEENERLEATQKDFDDASRGPAAKTSKDINAQNAATPTCIDLDEIVGNPAKQQQLSSPDNTFKVPAAVYQLINIKSSHNGKFGAESDFNRVAPMSNDSTSLVQPSMGGLDTPQQRAALNAIFAARTGVPEAQVPDLASLMMSPLLQGTAVTVE